MGLQRGTSQERGKGLEEAMIERADLVAAVEQAADGIVITDTAGKIQYVNPAFTAMTGYASQEAVGQHTRMLKSGAQPTEVYAELWKTIQSGQVWHGEIVNRRRDGTLYREEMRITPVRNSAGQISSYIAIKQDVTERRAAEDAQSFLAAIVESSDEAIFTFTPEGTIRTWNRGAETILGYPAQQAIGKHISMLVAAERAPRLQRYIERVLLGETIPQYESVCVRWDRQKIPVSITASPVRNPAREVAAISVILRDISGRREAEQARAFLASIVESSDDAIMGSTLDGTIATWNRGAELLFGYSSQEIDRQERVPAGSSRAAQRSGSVPGKPSGEGVPCQQLRHRPPQEGRTRGSMSRSLSLPSAIRPARWWARPASPAILRSAIQAERRLRENEELFHEVFEHAPFGMCVCDLEGRFRQVNAELCRMLGYSELELLAISLADLTHADDLQTTLQRMEEVRRDPGAGAWRRKAILHCNGSVVWVRVKMSAGSGRRGRRAVLRGACGRHHRAQADRGSAARKRRSLPHHGRRMPDHDVGDRGGWRDSIHQSDVP